MDIYTIDLIKKVNVSLDEIDNNTFSELPHTVKNCLIKCSELVHVLELEIVEEYEENED